MANPAVTYARSGAADAQNEFAGLTVANGGALDSAATIDFSKCSIFRATVNNVSVALTPTNIGLGRTVKIHLRSGSATASTITWGTTGQTVNWIGAASPTCTASKATIITLTNDGAEVIGSYVVES